MGSLHSGPRLRASVGWGPVDGPAMLTPPAGPSQQERLKAQEHRAEMEEKVSKRSLEAAGKASLAAAGPGLLPRKPPGLATGPAGTYGKAMSPPPSPRASPVAALKAKVIQKLEDVTKPPPTYAYPATPSSHPSSPPPASPPPTPGITRKEEAPENVVEKKDPEKDASSPFQALFSGGRGGPRQCPVCEASVRPSRSLIDSSRHSETCCAPGGGPSTHRLPVLPAVSGRWAQW